MDPRLAVKARSGVLPAKAVTLPVQDTSAVLASHELFMQSSPVLASAQEFAMPHPGKSYGTWSWLTLHRDQGAGDGFPAVWQETTDFGQRTGSAGLPVYPLLIQDGWLRLRVPSASGAAIIYFTVVGGTSLVAAGSTVKLTWAAQLPDSGHLQLTAGDGPAERVPNQSPGFPQVIQATTNFTLTLMNGDAEVDRQELTVRVRPNPDRSAPAGGAAMSEPVIPSLELAHDNSAMGTNSPDTYGLHLEVDAPEAWVYVPAGRFPDYTPQIVVSALADNTAAALCASSTAAGQINVKLPARASLSAAGFDTASKTYSWTISITSDDPATVVIGPQTPLAFDLTNITPDNIPGSATITLAPRMKANQGSGKTDIEGAPLFYTVDKSEPPLVIEDVKWSLLTRGLAMAAPSWTVTGDVRDCVVRANGEEIGHPIGSGIEYSASLILQSGPQALAITATDLNGNTATYSENKDFSDFNPYFRLQVSNRRPLSLVSS